MDELLGSEVTKHVTTVGGLDNEAEMSGVYRQSGYPGVSPLL